MTAPHLDPTVRHDMVFLFDVVDGNPNGDPDAGNRPRMDDESGQGLVTDVALKRKIRDTIALAAGDDPRYDIFVQAGYALNPRLEASYTSNGLELGGKGKITPEQAAVARAWLCDRYVDIRLFGAVLSVGKTQALGQIRGPVQVTMGRSIDPVFPMDHAITRVTQTKQEDIDKGESTEMGGKWTVPYGLYRAEVFYSATRGAQTGVDGRDLELLYRSLEMMFDHDRSATRGRLTPRGLYVFSHPDAFGAAPAHRLTERIRVARAEGSSDTAPRSFADYALSVNDDELPAGVHLTKLIA
ncbi:type I-C CRISPR-associated protein Cas7/Csd2 [Pseudonocardia asaccharolytica]|uniref:Type I-C CRISPR-associated protein Cas7/Csd2 n=1 Tax=Pseudonocardia asaccharolytica DSM 44247 = NBRC 16224 TaxID=1123024 RepID=A0A511DDD0_9PSEU|nr:type I-C CRISPR-associated protein Cas7/Csd2 [Pseudonocardia asaccharolytica]GEL20978.1 type I-C CRISPR-associated protein Cas7/Csd2 [Pseudonocardia asaccharolytica DSM 44247 = NBRC 16224]